MISNWLAGLAGDCGHDVRRLTSRRPSVVCRCCLSACYRRQTDLHHATRYCSSSSSSSSHRCKTLKTIYFGENVREMRRLKFTHLSRRLNSPINMATGYIRKSPNSNGFRFRTRFRTLSVVVGARRWYHSIRRMRFPTSVLYSTVIALLAPFLRLMPPECKTPHFPYPTRPPLQNSRSQDIRIRIAFRMQIAKTQAYSVTCPSPLFVALCDDNSPTLQTDGRTTRLSHKRDTREMHIQLHVTLKNSLADAEITRHASRCTQYRWPNSTGSESDLENFR